MNNKEVKLKDLHLAMLADKKLPLKTNLVFGDGSSNASIVFIGEAPGAKEDELGLPFVGRSGKLLNKSLEEIGLSREKVYITNIVKRRPPENRDPSLEEVIAYKPYLEKQLDIIKPKLVVTLGRFALNYFLPEEKISKVQGNIYKFDNFLLIPMLHPAAAMRSISKMKDFKKTFLKLEKNLNKKDAK